VKYKVGQRIYYTGDIANQPGWFEVSAIVCNPYCKGYDLKELDGERTFRSVYEISISDRYEGHCGIRFVTEEAYKAYRERQIAQLVGRR